MMGALSFKSEQAFVAAFSEELLDSVRQFPEDVGKRLTEFVEETARINSLQALFKVLKMWCGKLDRKLVMMIDEIDTAANNQVFVDFLAQLRAYYLKRPASAAFHSVILAGVYDIRNIQQKIRPDEEHKINSPWNIAADFLVDMSFSAEDIAGMLEEYEQDHGTGMDIMAMAQRIYDYTSGYPYLVSRLCKLMDERVGGGGEYPRKCQVWTKAGFLEAIRLLMGERNTLFDSLVGKIQNDQDLRNVLHGVISRERR